MLIQSSNGGQFEFLPVTVESAGMVFTAMLRVGVHAGFDVDLDLGLLGDVTDLSVSSGIEVGVYATVAELTTNITYQPDNDECDLSVEQTYNFGLAAAAGATFAIGTQSWGPAANTSTPIFYTTMASACALQASPKVTAPSNVTAVPTPAADKRQVMSTATISTVVTQTGIQCVSTGLADCPASLQMTKQKTVTSSTTTIVPSGIDVDDLRMPAAVSNAVATTVAFGTNAVKMMASSGVPKSYIPPPPPTPTPTDIIDHIEHEAKNVIKRPLVLGLSAGLGGAFVIALLATCM